jgi:hypothetical protein
MQIKTSWACPRHKMVVLFANNIVRRGRCPAPALFGGKMRNTPTKKELRLSPSRLLTRYHTRENYSLNRKIFFLLFYIQLCFIFTEL